MRLWRPLLLCLTLAACGAQPDAGAGPMAPEAIVTTALDAPAVPAGVDTDVPLAAIAALPGPAPLATEAEPPVAAEAGEPAEPIDAADAAVVADPGAPPDAAPEEPAEPLSRAAAACAARGGVFASPPDGGARACVRRTGDAGKSCRSGSDCQGQCLARSGTCAPIDPLLGCNEVFQDDGTRVTLCID